jgi:hypothetical protein
LDLNRPVQKVVKVIFHKRNECYTHNERVVLQKLNSLGVELYDEFEEVEAGEKHKETLLNCCGVGTPV